MLSKERSKRHHAPMFLKNMAPIPRDHDIALHKDVAVRNGNDISIVFITCIESDDGHRERSTSSSSRSRFWGSVYEVLNEFFLVVRPVTSKVTSWLPVSCIICEVKLECINGKLRMDDKSQSDIRRLRNKTGNSNSSVTKAPEYVVEDVISHRINHCTHETEFLVKIVGSDEKHWLPQSSFQQVAQFSYTSVSSRGRKRTHKQPQQISGKLFSLLRIMLCFFFK